MKDRKFFNSKACVRAICFTLVLALGGQSVFASSAFAASPAGKPQQRGKVQIESGSAVSDGQNGTWIEWATSYEIDNLGFAVSRLDKDGGGRVLLTESPIPGSFSVVGEKPLHGGKSYEFFDRTGATGDRYEITILNMDGATTNFILTAVYDAEMFSRVPENFKGETAPNNFVREYPAPLKGESDNAIEADSAMQRWVASRPGVKFGIRSKGIYRVSRQQLIDGGFDTSVPTPNWQLYADGIEQNILITGADAGGVLGANGYIEFWGRGQDTLYTDIQTFYLVVGTTPGKRITSAGIFGKARELPTAFPAVIERKDRTVYNGRIVNGETENYFAALMSGPSPPSFPDGFPANFTLNMPALGAENQTVALEVITQGSSFGAHVVKVSLNGTQIGTLTGIGQVLMRDEFTVPASLLVAGNNVVRVALQDQGDSVYADTVRIRYLRPYIAANNSLEFTTYRNRAARVDGFTTNDVRVFDVTAPDNVRLVNTQIVADGSNFSVITPVTLPGKFFAAANSIVQTPFSITPNLPSDLYNTTLDKDLIIVTHKNWRAAADALATYRQGQGVTAMVVDVEDVMDEFSFGAVTPKGLREFFRRSMPDYAILFGDATIDGRNYTNRGYHNYIPTTQMDSGYGEIASDEATVDFIEETPPTEPQTVGSFPIGRLPVRDLASAQVVVGKIQSFETLIGNSGGNPFTRGALFVCDDPEGYDFCQTNQIMAAKLPAGTPIQHIARGGATSTTAQPVRDAIVNAVNQGKLIVGYAGHGNLAAWTSASIFRRDGEVPRFTNANSLSIFIHLTCLNGAFAEPSGESLAEAIFKAPNGGGAIVWSSSGLTIADGQDIMGGAFYDRYRLAPTGSRVGDLARQAKLATFDPDVQASWSLIGDPMTKIK